MERELFKPDEVPERHNLSFFPTVNDIKNHIHEVQKSLRNGEMVYNSESIPAMVRWPLCFFLIFGVKYWKSCFKFLPLNCISSKMLYDFVFPAAIFSVESLAEQDWIKCD